MVEKLIIKDGRELNTYILQPILGARETHKGECSCNIKMYGPIDGCWIIKLYQAQSEEVIIEDLGIAKTQKEIPDKVYGCALKAGERYAKHLGCQLVDETKQGLEKLAKSRIPIDISLISYLY